MTSPKTKSSPPGRNRWWSLSVASLATLIVTIDTGQLSIALPLIIKEFDADLGLASWLALVYALITASLYLPCGRLSDLFGLGKLFLGGFILYSLSSFAAGVAHGSAQLIVCRALQAGGSALIMANNFALVTALFPPEERGRAMGIAGGTISALGYSLGPVLGGLLTHLFGWRSNFYLSGTLALSGFAAARMLLPPESFKGTSAKKEPFDFVGAIGFAIGISSLLLSLALVQKGQWQHPLVGFTAIAGAGVLSFVCVVGEASEISVARFKYFSHPGLLVGKYCPLVQFHHYERDQFTDAVFFTARHGARSAAHGNSDCADVGDDGASRAAHRLDVGEIRSRAIMRLGTRRERRCLGFFKFSSARIERDGSRFRLGFNGCRHGNLSNAE